jgi:hypothetical protein
LQDAAGENGLRFDNCVFIICASLCKNSCQGVLPQPINLNLNTMRRPLSLTDLPLCRPVAARRVAGVAAAHGVNFEGAPPGVPVR